MIDNHICPENWGLRPVLFSVGKVDIYSYPVFIGLALIAGILVYYYEARQHRSLNEKTFYIFIAALAAGALGAKIPIWVANFKQIIAAFPDLSLLLPGRTIIGGLIGGALGVILVKKKLNIKQRKGNLFAPAIALGIFVGRIGCFLRGC